MTATTENQQSTTQEPKTFIITEFKKSGGIDVVKAYLASEYAGFTEEVRLEVPDVNTVEGRKRIKALAADSNKKLSELDTPIRDYLRDIKKQPKLIEAIAKDNKTNWTAFRAGLLKPLEDAQADQDAVINWLNGVPAQCSGDITSAGLSVIIKTVNTYTADLVWPELKKKFKVAHENALTTATVTLERIEKDEAQAAELAKLQAEAKRREQEDRDRIVAEEAAKKAIADAEAKALREKEATERRAVEAKQREEDAKERAAKAQRDAELAEDRRVKEAEESKQREAQAKIDAQARQEAAVKKAAADEVARIAEEEAEQKALADSRAADKARRTPINRAALVALVAEGISEDDAKTVIRAIANHKVPNVHIAY